MAGFVFGTATAALVLGGLGFAVEAGAHLAKEWIKRKACAAKGGKR